MREIQFREPNPETQKILICSKSGEGTVESSRATRFSNTTVKSSKSLLQMRGTENFCKQTCETKSDIKKLYSVVVCSKFLVKALHMTHGRF